MAAAVTGCIAGEVAGAAVSTANHVYNNGWEGAAGAAADGLYGGGMVGTGVGALSGCCIAQVGVNTIPFGYPRANSERDMLLQQVNNTSLKNAINELYRPGGNIGDGGG